MVDMVVMAADGEEGEMTIAEVMKEMRKHLEERKAPEEHLVLTATWRQLVDSDMRADTFERRVRAQPGGKELWAVYTQTVKERRQQFVAALRVAASERRSVYAVAKLWGMHMGGNRLPKLGIKPQSRAIDFERLQARAKVGMTLKQLGQALGVTDQTLGHWLRHGKLAGVVKFGRQPVLCHWRWVVTEVVQP
jgi:hypothetical protein